MCAVDALRLQQSYQKIVPWLTFLLITGAGGFLGRRLIELGRERGWIYAAP
jgi:hypothetical protein